MGHRGVDPEAGVESLELESSEAAVMARVAVAHTTTNATAPARANRLIRIAIAAPCCHQHHQK